MITTIEAWFVLSSYKKRIQVCLPEMNNLCRIKDCCFFVWRQITGRTMVRYLIVGFGLFLVDLSIFMLLKLFGVSTPLAQAVSRTTGATAGFLTHKLFTFRNKSRKTAVLAVQGSGYIANTVFTIVISPLIVSGLEHLIPHNLIIVKILTEIIMVTEVYIAMRFIFKNRVVLGRNRAIR